VRKPQLDWYLEQTPKDGMKNPEHEISNPKQIQNRAEKFETMVGETRNVMTGFPVKFSA